MLLIQGEHRIEEPEERTATSAVESHAPRHMNFDGLLGKEIETAEWLDSQLKVSCRAVLELMRAPRHPDDDAHLKGECMPPVPPENEDIAYHLLQVHNHGMSHGSESWQAVRAHPEASEIIMQWLNHFGTLFNVMAKQSRMPYEEVATRIHSFQMRLVEHIQHLRRIWELHAEQQQDGLSALEVWNTMEWAEPKIRRENGLEFLRQTVRLPHVEGYRRDVHLVLNGERHTRESLVQRLTPMGRRIPSGVFGKMGYQAKQAYRWLCRSKQVIWLKQQWRSLQKT